MAIEAARLFVKVGSDTREGEAGLKSFNDKLNAAARTLTTTGAVMTGALTVPLALAAKTALTSAADFEQSMNILQQVTGASADSMSALSKQALELGALTSFSAGEAAQGMLELGKAGMGTEQIMAAIPGVLDLAAAGGVSLANAANLTAATLNAFGLAATESTRIADMLAAAANASAADISGLGQGMQQAGFAFRLANQPVDNLAASLAILTNVGLTGSDAGTALKNAFMRMMNPTEEAKGVMDELGISFYDAQGNMRLLPDIIDILNTATAGLTSEQRDAALATLFLSDGMKAMIPLMNAGGAGFNEMLGAVNQAGAATDVANARMSGLAGGIEYLAGSVDSFLIGAALPFTEMLGNLARAAGDALTWFGALPQPVINATLAFLGVLALAGPLVTGLGLVAGALAFLITPLGLVVAASAGLAAAWAADFMGIQGHTASAVTSIQAQFNVLRAQALAVGTAVGAAFSKTKFPTLSQLWADFKAGDFSTLASTIRETAFTLMVNLDSELNISAKAQGFKAELLGVVNSLGTAIAGLDFSGAKANLDGLRDNVLVGIATAVNGVAWGEGGSAFSGLVNKLTAEVKALDFSGVDWGAALKTGLLGPVGLAVKGLAWVVGSEDFAGLKHAVLGAITSISWGDIGTSLTGLGTALGAQLGKIGKDAVADINAEFATLPAFKLPELKALELKLPKVELPTIDVDWEQMVISTVGLVNSVKTSINGIDWVGVGEGLGSGLLTAAKGVGVAIGAVFSAGAWLEQTRISIAASALGLATNIGFEIGTALANVNVVDALVQLEGAVKAALIKMVFGAATSISTGLGLAIKLPSLTWSDYIPAFTDWTSFVSSLTWADFVASITWADFVAALGWDTFVPNITWSTFVPKVSWSSFVPDMSWSSFVPSIDWGRFIPSLFGGGSSSGSSSSGGGYSSGNTVQDSVDFNAAGSDYFAGGQTWVGESGPELVTLPRGSRILDNERSMQVAGGGGMTIVIEHVTINSDMDIHSAAAKLAREFQRRVR